MKLNQNKKNIIILSSLSAILLSILIPLCVVKGEKGDIGNTGNKGETGLIGENGNPGNPGIDGEGLIYGSDIPNESIGKEGDYYLNQTNGELYKKVKDFWIFQTIFKGEKGESGEDGDDGNNGSDGSNGANGNKYASSYIEKTSNGNVIPSKGNVRVGETITYTIKPNSSYSLLNLYLNGNRVDEGLTYDSETNSYIYKTTMSEKGNAINAQFANASLNKIVYFKDDGRLKAYNIDGYKNYLGESSLSSDEGLRYEESGGISSSTEPLFNLSNGKSIDNPIEIKSYYDWTHLVSIYYWIYRNNFKMESGLYYKVVGDIKFSTKYADAYTRIYDTPLINFNGHLDGGSKEGYKFINFSSENDIEEEWSYYEGNTYTWNNGVASIINSTLFNDEASFSNYNITFDNSDDPNLYDYELYLYSNYTFLKYAKGDVTLDNIVINGELEIEDTYGGIFNYYNYSFTKLTMNNCVNNVNISADNDYCAPFVGKIINYNNLNEFKLKTFSSLTNNGFISNSNINGKTSLLIANPENLDYLNENNLIKTSNIFDNQ